MDADGLEQRGDGPREFGLVEAEVEVEYVEELTLHQVDFGGREVLSVANPVLILRRRVCSNE